MPSASSIAPHASGILFVFEATKALVDIVFVPSACVRVCSTSPFAPSLSQCLLLSTSVTDHRWKSICSRQVSCPAKSHLKSPNWKGGPMKVRMAYPSPNTQAGFEVHRSHDNTCGGSKKARGTASWGRTTPQVAC